MKFEAMVVLMGWWYAGTELISEDIVLEKGNIGVEKLLGGVCL
jgi:hypothetical protein